MRRTGILLVCWALSGCDCSDDPAGAPNNTAPQVAILAPPDGTTVRTGTNVVLVGEAADAEDGVLVGLQWSSSLDGGLGSGTSVTTQLSQGQHDIVVVVVDSDGAVARDQITVNVTGANQAPAAFIDNPSNGHSITEGDDVTLVGRGEDPEDGTLAGAALFWTSSLDGALGSGASVTVAPTLGVHVVVLTVVDGEGAQGQASISIEVVPLGANQRPVVVIDTPLSGASFEEDTVVSFGGSATDPEDGALTDAALVWTSDVAGVLATGATFTRDDLALGVHAITLTATDSQLATGSASVTISINPGDTTPPTATITAPATGTAYVSGTAVSLEGTGDDAEDGPLTGTSLVWSSSVDGVLGDGSPRVVDTLSVGAHTITLTATDADDATGTDEIALTILAPNQPPQVSISSPADGLTFTAGDVIAFTGEAIDTEDGPLSGAALLWSSNLDGNMGTGADLDYGSLSAGQHTVTLVAIDSGGLSGSDAVDVLIEAAPQNLPPVAWLTGPNNAAVGIEVTFDGSASTDPDGTIVDYEFDFGDATSPQSGTATTASHTFVSEGTYVVTLTVTDDDAATHSATHTIRIGEQTRIPEIISDVADALGSVCDVEMDGSDTGHVIFRNDTHPSLWYATHDGAWQTELVDGMGWDIGGEVTDDMALTLDAGGTPHIVYIITIGNDMEVRYATKSGSAWTLETIVAAGNLYQHVDIEIGATGEPAVLYSQWLSGIGYRPTIATRVGADNWSISPGAASRYAAGGLELDGSGVLHVTITSSSTVYVSTWTSSGWGSVDSVTTLINSSERVALALDASGNDVLVHELGVDHDLGGGTWQRSELESWTIEYIDVAADASTELSIGLRHGTDLELIHSANGDFWQREYQGPMDATKFGVDIDSTGALHACFFRDDTLLFY